MEPGKLLAVSNLAVDFINGSPINFGADTVLLTSNSKNPLFSRISYDFSGELSALSFQQSGAATLAGSAGAGTFSVPGILHATFGNLLPSLGLAVGGLPLFLEAEPQSASIPYALTGTWQITGPPNNAKVSLDGNVDAELSLLLTSAFNEIVTEPFAFTLFASVDLEATASVLAVYHLEQEGILIPEPASIVLLFLGSFAALILCSGSKLVGRVWRR